MGIDSAFLKKDNRLLRMKVKCATCGGRVDVFVNSMSSAGEAWPFCEKCGTYVNVVPND